MTLEELKNIVKTKSIESTTTGETIYYFSSLLCNISLLPEVIREYW